MDSEVSVLDQPPVRSIQEDLAGKCLTFYLDAETYGVPILKVQEIIGIMPATAVPSAPPFVRGLVNLRGRVIPVIDLRVSFGMAPKEDTERTCIVVVQIDSDGGQVTLGTVVDEVLEVLEVSPEQIEPVPSFGTRVDTSFILGIAKVAGAVVTLLDLDKVISDEEAAALHQDSPN